MQQRKIKRLKTISEYHKSRGLPPPEHPLISIVDYKDIQRPDDIGEVNWMLDFYQVSLKRGMTGKVKYGQQEYDFDEGIMFFIGPGQVFRIEASPKTASDRTGWMLMVHPDFFWKTTLAVSMKQFEFFGYTVNEALFLSEKEEKIMNSITQHILQEYHGNIDKFTQHIIVAHLETLLSYAERFYERQFITRKIGNHKILTSLENLLNGYFSGDDLSTNGLPTVQFVADALHVSPNYLSRLLKTITGKTTQQLIQDKLVEAAKEKLSGTQLSVSEIAYELGFEHPQSFIKLFKSKTSQTPLAFRQSFN